jgi:hypothetical protein
MPIDTVILGIATQALFAATQSHGPFQGVRTVEASVWNDFDRAIIRAL